MKYFVEHHLPGIKLPRTFTKEAKSALLAISCALPPEYRVESVWKYRVSWSGGRLTVTRVNLANEGGQAHGYAIAFRL